MVAGADSIDDMALLRHGAMGTLFDRPYAPSTLGSFLREFTFGHVRQLDAVASRLLAATLPERRCWPESTARSWSISTTPSSKCTDTPNKDPDTATPGSGALNALIATVTTERAAPVITGQRLRKGACGSPRGAARMIADTLATVARLRSAEATAKPLMRVDSAFYGHPSVAAAIRGGRRRVDHRAPGPESQGRHRRHRRRRLDPDRIHRRPLRRNHPTMGLARRGRRDRVHRVQFPKGRRAGPGQTGGAPHPRPPPRTGQGQQTLFDTWRFHAFFTTTDLDTVTADKTHRGHAIIEQVHADLKDSALAHLPSGRFTANAAWLVLAVIAFNLTRAAATLTGPALAKSRTATIRRTLITVPARIASSARRLTLHLPRDWPWETAWNTLFNNLFHRHQPLIA